MRPLFSFAVLAGIAVLLGSWLAVESRAQTPEKPSIDGAWTRNAELSDVVRGADGERGDGRGRGAGGGRSGHGHGGGGGGGGFGGGFGRGGGGGGARPMPNPEETERLRDALRTIMQPGDHLTITQTESMVVMTDQDGHTTRLAPDGKKVKDENTHIERRTRWDGGKLVSEITGARPGKITQTFSVDPETRRLRVEIQAEGGGNTTRRSVTQIYDADQR